MHKYFSINYLYRLSYQPIQVADSYLKVKKNGENENSYGFAVKCRRNPMQISNFNGKDGWNLSGTYSKNFQLSNPPHEKTKIQSTCYERIKNEKSALLLLYGSGSCKNYGAVLLKLLFLTKNYIFFKTSV